MKAKKRELIKARVYAASVDRKIARASLLPNFGFASHVTYKDKLKYKQDLEILADEIILKKHDNNFTVCQRMQYYLTGECIPLFKKQG